MSLYLHICVYIIPVVQPLSLVVLVSQQGYIIRPDRRNKGKGQQQK